MVLNTSTRRPLASSSPTPLTWKPEQVGLCGDVILLSADWVDVLTNNNSVYTHLLCDFIH